MNRFRMVAELKHVILIYLGSHVDPALIWCQEKDTGCDRCDINHTPSNADWSIKIPVLSRLRRGSVHNKRCEANDKANTENN